MSVQNQIYLIMILIQTYVFQLAELEVVILIKKFMQINKKFVTSLVLIYLEENIYTKIVMGIKKPQPCSVAVFVPFGSGAQATLQP